VWRSRYASPAEVPPSRRDKIPPTLWPPASAAEGAALGLQHCLRLLPHLHDTGGFFVCVLSKHAELLRGHDYQLGSEAEPHKQPAAKHAAKVAAAAATATPALLPPSPAKDAEQPPKKRKTSQSGDDSAAATTTSAAAAAAAAAVAEDDGGGESFMRVHWVAVPKALRARRVNRRRGLLRLQAQARCEGPCCPCPCAAVVGVAPDGG
jgi:multisite-specific tRNA:(cytosine-C5)-methyltransferase